MNLKKRKYAKSFRGLGDEFIIRGDIVNRIWNLCNNRSYFSCDYFNCTILSREKTGGWGMIWNLKGLFIFLAIDIGFNLFRIPTAFSIGWLFAMVLDYKDLRKIRK